MPPSNAIFSKIVGFLNHVSYVEGVSEMCLNERLTPISFEVHVSPQTACAKHMGLGLIARIIEGVNNSSEGNVCCGFLQVFSKV